MDDLATAADDESFEPDSFGDFFDQDEEVWTDDVFGLICRFISLYLGIIITMISINSKIRISFKRWLTVITGNTPSYLLRIAFAKKLVFIISSNSFSDS